MNPCFLYLVVLAGVPGTLWSRYIDFAKTHAEIASYKGIANEIIKFAVDGKAQNQSYNRLAVFTDTFGNRIAGSENLENAIDYMMKEMEKDGLENVHGEKVQVPHWVRGKESAVMLTPRYHRLSILGLGSSISTPPEGITTDVLVVRSFDELHARASEVKGKIVVFNQVWVSYEASVSYRIAGATEAAKVGAVASLIRSVTPLSINSPHTGKQDYSENVTKIPTACITVEDAEMMHRMSRRGIRIVVQLKMEAKMMSPTVSRNVVAEIIGSKYPEQVVLVSGHLDSWDVGAGAMDDGGGAFISWQALSLIHQLGLQPKRTMRAVLWTAEEQGMIGAQQYFDRHKVNISHYDLVMESDIGTFTPQGIEFMGNEAAADIMKSVLQLLSPVNASQLVRTKGGGGDVAQWVKNGVPGGTLINDNKKYFYFHHTKGDTVTVQDPHMMDLCSAVWAVVSYVVADMEEMLPRDNLFYKRDEPIKVKNLK